MVGSHCTQFDPFTGLRRKRDLFYRMHAVQRDGSSQTSKFVVKELMVLCCWKLLIWLEGTYGAAGGKVAVLSNRGGAVDVVRKPTAADSMNGGGEAKTSSAMAVTDRGAEDSGINE
ncbi:hypothetical protein NC652_006668 [Populus alba x Populus x berolinensis]|nr:hypothetical protein NC652_006668 [Populus alba x Populus x berolinensis]